ncbi:hypothetical protein CAEBREN_09004 [Caenorhabditis brenneri]|uniref:Uncharacterized protein n=1 Tax=Caenorhabditis brenneri TaxID=135651 RepID=G0P4H3_CAEBE|nr:hypothetical protein CAEBREN_09004 [Caenorhabditis brenneri]
MDSAHLKLGNHATKAPWTVVDEGKWQAAVESAQLLVTELLKSYHLPKCFFNPYGTKILPQPVQELPSKMELFNIFEAPGAVSDKNAYKEYIKLMARLQVQQKNQVKAGFIHVVPRETFGTRWVMKSKEMV